MIICNKCRKEITSDLLIFQGEFKDNFTMSQLHICSDCILLFRDMLQQFFNTVIPEDEPDETKILRTKRFKCNK